MANAALSPLMEIIILGAGRVGNGLARDLVKNDCDVTVIDTDNTQLLKLQAKTDLRTIAGNAADPATLKEAGVTDANLVVAVTASDEVNLVACRVCKHLSENTRTIARIRSSRYDDSITQKGFEIERTFCPEKIVADSFCNAIQFPGCLSVHRFAGGALALACIRISSSTDIAGSSIGDLRRNIKEIDYRIVSVNRDGQILPPEADTRLFVGDDVYILAAAANLRQLTPHFAGPQSDNHRIFIAGGGNIGQRVAKAFEKDRIVKVVERDINRCKELSRELEGAIILKGDASDEDLLRQESIEEFDIFCAVTNDDEENILSAIQAKRLGVKKNAALTNHIGYIDLLERQLDIVLSPSRITIGQVLSEIRQGEFAAIHSLRHGTTEAVEIIAHGEAGTSHLVGREIQEIVWPEGVTPGAIIRPAAQEEESDRIYIIHDTTPIHPNDHLVCFATDRRAVRKLSKLAQVGINHIG